MTNPARHKRNIEILSMLLEKADIQGYLTTEDLMEVYPNVTEDRDRFEAILVALRRRGVDILDHDEAESVFDEIDDSLSDDFAPLTDLTRISSDDTVGLYLKRCRACRSSPATRRWTWQSASKRGAPPNGNLTAPTAAPNQLAAANWIA